MAASNSKSSPTQFSVKFSVKCPHFKARSVRGLLPASNFHTTYERWFAGQTIATFPLRQRVRCGVLIQAIHTVLRKAEKRNVRRMFARVSAEDF